MALAWVFGRSKVIERAEQFLEGLVEYDTLVQDDDDANKVHVVDPRLLVDLVVATADSATTQIFKCESARLLNAVVLLDEGPPTARMSVNVDPRSDIPIEFTTDLSLWRQNSNAAKAATYASLNRVPMQMMCGWFSFIAQRTHPVDRRYTTYRGPIAIAAEIPALRGKMEAHATFDRAVRNRETAETLFFGMRGGEDTGRLVLLAVGYTPVAKIYHTFPMANPWPVVWVGVALRLVPELREAVLNDTEARTSIVARIAEDRETRPFVCWLDLDVTDEDRVDCHERAGRIDCRCDRIEETMNAFEHVQELYVFVLTDETVEYFDAPLTEPALTVAVRAGRGPRARINTVSLESVAVPAITDELVARYAPPPSERRAEYWPAHGLE